MRDSVASRGHRGKWLENARRRLPIFRESNSIYMVNQKRVKVLHSNVNKKGLSWFTDPIAENPNEAQGSRNIDAYVLICGSERRFYAIPRDILTRIGKDTKSMVNPNKKQIINIKPKTSQLKIGRSKWRRINKYLNYWTCFKSTHVEASSRSVKRNRFEKRVERWLKGILGSRKRASYLLKKTKIVGRSGNRREIDFAILVKNRRNANSKIRILMELKSFGQLKKNPRDPTFKSHMDRAFSLLGDFPGTRRLKKFVIVPKKAHWGKLSYDKMFGIIDVTIIEFTKIKSRSYLENTVKQQTNLA